MTARPTGLVYQKLRAPREDGGRFLQPSIADFPALWKENVRSLAEWISLEDGSLEEWSPRPREARLELLELVSANDSTFKVSARLDHEETNPNATPPPIVMTGHQPELFHPGVWFKNFVVGALAKQAGATPVHIVMDNDVGGDPAIQVPTVRNGIWHRQRVAYDVGGPLVPHEERHPIDRHLFDSFETRVCASVERLVTKPLIKELWPSVLEEAGKGLPTGDCLVAARSQIERSRGLKLRVVKMSELAQTRSFVELTLQLVDSAARFRRVHNEVLGQYRDIHRIRSPLQPMPDLRTDGEWIECPCWVWTTAEPTRQRLFARATQLGLEISDMNEFQQELSGERPERVDQWLELRERGVKIRPRAILSTLYFRLLLCDWFVHGIGGGKYDQVTDEIIRRLFGATPSVFQIATSTHHLSSSHQHADASQLRRLVKQLRDLEYHAEHQVSSGEITDQLIGEKRYWTTGNWASSHSAKRRHDEICRINTALQAHVEPLRRQLETQLNRDRRDLESCRVLESREYSFCLFPETSLSQLMDVST